MHHYLRSSHEEFDESFSKREWSPQILAYNETNFRHTNIPVLWLDSYLDVRWNHAAEYGMLSYLARKQFPLNKSSTNLSFNQQQIMNACQKGSLFLLYQNGNSGFCSRVLCFIAQFGQTLYTPRIGVLKASGFSQSHKALDDFHGEGILRYFLPISLCSAYVNHPNMSGLGTNIKNTADTLYISRSYELHKHANEKANRAFYSSEFWKMDYHHVPIRKWLFDRTETSVSYDSPITVLANHSNEHIYALGNAKDVEIGDWINRNKPDAFSSDLLPNNGKYNLTWQDYVFGSFLRYMFVRYFFSQNAPRIEYGSRILTEHWRSYLIGKYSRSLGNDVFTRLAGLHIRRGDKMTEDSFWHKHNRWRNLSYYVKAIVDEEQRRNVNFTFIFVLTDEANVLTYLQDYANPKSTGRDEPYAREHLRGREILHNVLAPRACTQPFQRMDFDQFLVSLRFLAEHARFTVGHNDSNVFRLFREITYTRRQHQPGVQTITYTRSAPDSLTDTRIF
jgi:hypothetical protein